MAKGPYYEVEFQRISAAFKTNDYVKAIGEASYLLQEVLKEVLQDAESKLDGQDLRGLTNLTQEIGGGIPRARFRLDQMAQLFTRFPLLEKLSELDPENPVLVLLKTYDLVKLVNLIEHIQTRSEGKKLDSVERERIKFAVQHVLLCLAAFLNYAGRLRLTTIEILPSVEEINQIHELFHEKRMEALQLLGLDPSKDEQVGLKLFDLVKERGLLFNRSDQTRNVSLKVATLVNLLTQIREGIKEVQGKVTAEEILRKAGYDCGLRFGTEMYEIIQRQRTKLTDSEKVDRWCEFDSDVGFGRFHNHLDFNQQRFEVTGEISLSDNFLVVNQVSQQTSEDDAPHLCSFMTGYIQGVLEKIFRAPFAVKHKIEECEQGDPSNKESFFHIKSTSARRTHVRDQTAKLAEVESGALNSRG